LPKIGSGGWRGDSATFALTENISRGVFLISEGAIVLLWRAKYDVPAPENQVSGLASCYSSDCAGGILLFMCGCIA
jgi:hypothetical protein